MTRGCTRNLFRVASTVIVLTFFQPSAAQAQDPKVEMFLVAVFSELRSELVSSTRAVDFGQVSSGGLPSFGVAIGFRPISKLGIEFDGFHLRKYSLDARVREVVDLEKDYTGYSVSGNAVFQPFKIDGNGNDSYEPYFIGGLGVLHLESTTTETLLGPPGPCLFIFCTGIGPRPSTVEGIEISSSTSNEFAANVGVGIKAFPISWFSFRPEYRFFISSSVKLNRLSFALGFHW
jgi:hypothetical protein